MSNTFDLNNALKEVREQHNALWDAECLNALKSTNQLFDSIFCSRIPEIHEYPINIQASYIIILYAFPVIIGLLILSSSLRRWKMGNTTKRNEFTFWSALLIPILFLAQLFPTIEKIFSPHSTLLTFGLFIVSIISWLITKKRTGAERWSIRVIDILLLVTTLSFIAGQTIFTRFQSSDAKILKRQVYWDYIEQQDKSK